MSSERFHRAARDGLVEILREANRHEVNARDDTGMTPVLWAAFEGHLDALRILVGRGGNPDKSDQFGNTTLHLAASKGHIECLDFLVKFGANIYALDIYHHSPKDIASINNRDDILKYLDTVATNLERTDKKKADKWKRQADQQMEKRYKQYVKKMKKTDQKTEYESHQSMPHRSSTNIFGTLRKKIWSSSQGNLSQLHQQRQQQHQQHQQHQSQYHRHELLSNTTRFSENINNFSSARGAVQKKAEKARQINGLTNGTGGTVSSNDFRIGEMEANGKRSVRSLQGVVRNSEIIYVGTFNSMGNVNSKRGKIADVFDVDTSAEVEEIDRSRSKRGTYGALAKSVSQPNFLKSTLADDSENSDASEEEIIVQRPSGLFDRPKFGTVAFQRFAKDAFDDLNQAGTSSGGVGSVSSTSGSGGGGGGGGGGGRFKKKSSSNVTKVIKPRPQLTISDDDSDTDEPVSSDEGESGDDGLTPLERFLKAWQLDSYSHIFVEHHVDLDTLMLLTQDDLKSLKLPLGPFRRLEIAINERKMALTNSEA